jgi:hypothetical protein
MENLRQQTALNALELVLRGILKCEDADTDTIQIVSEPDPNEHDLIKVLGFTVSRREMGTGRIRTARFVAFGEQIQINGKLVPIGDYLINAANMFLKELLRPRSLGRCDSVARLIAGSIGINLDQLFFAAGSSDAAGKRLYPQS